MSEIIYEFRPTPNYFDGEFRRYADGLWIPDDGEYDLAFISNHNPPICLYVEVPYHPNIICSWLTTHWRESVKKHPRGNPWHYAVKDPAIGWGPCNEQRDSTPNGKAGREGMSKLCSQFSCANGRDVEFHADDPHIKAGLLRNRETKEVFTWPEGMKCMYCGIEAPVYETSATLTERAASLD